MHVRFFMQIFEFVIQKFYALRKPKTNIQILQQSVLLKYKYAIFSDQTPIWLVALYCFFLVFSTCLAHHVSEKFCELNNGFNIIIHATAASELAHPHNHDL